MFCFFFLIANLQLLFLEAMVLLCNVLVSEKLSKLKRRIGQFKNYEHV